MRKLYLAPMEEITGYVFRNVQNRHFGFVDKYFTPFISPDNRIMKTRSRNELERANNSGLVVVPQLLTNDAELFNDAAKLIAGLGYEEININFGCPSNTVAAKFKGSGILRAPELMDRFLDGIFNKKDSALINYPNLRISVKTRVGYNDTSDFEKVTDVLNRYPFSEIIIHPRLKKDLYGGVVRMDMFDMGCELLGCDITYNGDIFSEKDHKSLTDHLDGINAKRSEEEIRNASKITAVMIGRGAVADPGIFRQIRTGRATTTDELYDFLEDLYETYKDEMGSGNAISKLKEVWSYTTRLIPDEKERSRTLKSIIKSKSEAEYKDAALVARSKISL